LKLDDRLNKIEKRLEILEKDSIQVNKFEKKTRDIIAIEIVKFVNEHPYTTKNKVIEYLSQNHIAARVTTYYKIDELIENNIISYKLENKQRYSLFIKKGMTEKIENLAT
jgi:hypothetical protein